MIIPNLIYWLTVTVVLLFSLLTFLQIVKPLSSINKLEISFKRANFTIFSSNRSVHLYIFFSIVLVSVLAFALLGQTIISEKKFSYLILFYLAGCVFALIVSMTLAIRLFSRLFTQTLRGVRATTSKIFRYFLYHGAAITLFTNLVLMVMLVFIEIHIPGKSGTALLMGVFLYSVTMLQLRTEISIKSRSLEIAHELLAKQESLFAGDHLRNPLHELKKNFNAINRFIFAHNEYLILMILALVLSIRFEIEMKRTENLAIPSSIIMFSLISAIPAYFMMRVKDRVSPETFLWNIRIGYILAFSIQVLLCYSYMIVWLNLSVMFFWVYFFGGLSTLILSFHTTLLTAESHKASRSLAASAAISIATMVNRAIAMGMRGTVVPTMLMILMISVVYVVTAYNKLLPLNHINGLSGITLALLGMVSMLPVTQITAIVLPISESVLIEVQASALSDKADLLEKFRQLRSVATPSYILHQKLKLFSISIMMFIIFGDLIRMDTQQSLLKQLSLVSGILFGGIYVFYVYALVNEKVTELSGRLLNQTRILLRQGSDLHHKKDFSVKLISFADRYIIRKTSVMFILTLGIPAAACFAGGIYALSGYLISFGFFSFLLSMSWLTTGAALKSAKNSAESDLILSKQTGQMQALTQGEMIGTAMVESAAPIILSAMLTTAIGAIVFSGPTLELHLQLKDFIKNLL